MPKVTLIKDGKPQTFEAEAGQNLLEIGLKNGLDILHACGGNGFCSTCMCTVKEHPENANPITDEELAMGVDPASPKRLSCMTKVEGDITAEFDY